jgi:sugar phosphate isomerase/epimerase
VGTDLAIAQRLTATCLEILPDWRAQPDPAVLRVRVGDLGLTIHSAHGCWGGQSIRANRVDLGEVDTALRQASVNDLKWCVDWLNAVGGNCLVIHPGGLSDPEQFNARRGALADALTVLAEHARGTGIVLCVENMPPGVFPGSRMADLADLVTELDLPEVALALDTGHANITSSAASETRSAGPKLGTTHVHDNDGRQDTHNPPGLGSVDWDAWLDALDGIGYAGPVMLECIRYLRDYPESIDQPLFGMLDRLTRRVHGATGTIG